MYWYVEIGILEVYGSHPYIGYAGECVYWYVEIGILEVYGSHPFPYLNGGPDTFWCFHLEFL